MLSKLKENISWPFAVGFALNFTWTSSVFFHSLLYASAGHSFTFSNFYLASMAVLIVSLALMGICSQPVTRSFEKPSVLIVAGSLLFLGTMAAANATYESLPGIVLFWVGVVFTGLGSAYLLALWGWYLGARTPHAAPSICAAYALAAPLYFAFALLPSSITVAVVSLLPALSLWVYFTFGRTAPELILLPETDKAVRPLKKARGKAAEADGRGQDAQDETQRIHDLAQMGFLPRITLAAVLFGIVLAMMNYMPADEGPSNSFFALVFLFAAEIPLIAFLTYFLVYRGKSSFQDRFLLMYRTAVLVMMGAVLLSVAMAERNLAFQVIALSGYICLKSVFWSLFATISRNSKVSPVVVFCFGEGSLTAGLFIGNQLNGFLGSHYGSTIAALTLAILLLAYMFVLNERRVLAITNEPEEDEEGEPTHQRFHARCDEIAAEYKLSRRETEVFYLFARGRSSSRIADDLYVSAGTVSTHLRNIYRKLDVHSRQELLDLIEGSGE